MPGGLEFMKAAGMMTFVCYDFWILTSYLCLDRSSGWQQDDAANALVLPATFDTSAMAEAVDILNQALSSGLFGNSLGP